MRVLTNAREKIRNRSDCKQPFIAVTEEEEAANEDLYGAVNTKNIDQIPVFDLNPQVDKGEQSMEVVANSKGQSSSHLKSASNWDQGWNYLQLT